MLSILKSRVFFPSTSFTFFLFFIFYFILNVDIIWVNNMKMGERKVWLSLLRVSKLITILIFVSWDTEIFNYVK